MDFPPRMVRFFTSGFWDGWSGRTSVVWEMVFFFFFCSFNMYFLLDWIDFFYFPSDATGQAVVQGGTRYFVVRCDTKLMRIALIKVDSRFLKTEQKHRKKNKLNTTNRTCGRPKRNSPNSCQLFTTRAPMSFCSSSITRTDASRATYRCPRALVRQVDTTTGTIRRLAPTLTSSG